MTNIRRLGTVNGVLLALYFVPVWTLAVSRIMVFPMRGIYERANIGPALFLNDYFQLLALGTVRFAWLLAIGKLIVVAFFCVFFLLNLRAAIRGEGDGDEALTIAIIAGGAISFASMIMAAYVGETAAVQLHATEALLLLGGLAILAVDAPAEAPQPAAAATPEFYSIRPNA